MAQRMSCSGNELLAGDAREIRNGLDAVVGVRVDARADGAASEAEFAERLAGLLKKLLALLDGKSISREFLAETNRHGILHMSAPRLHDSVELFGFGGEGGGQRVEDGIEGFQIQQRGEAHAGGKHVIGRLAVVDVVVGVNVGVVAEVLPRESRWPGWRSPRWCSCGS